MNDPTRLSSFVVVKVGGSLYDHPSLGTGIRQYLEELAAATVLFVPGGGSVCNVVRELDRIHHLGEEAAHWLSLTALWTTMEFLRGLIPNSAYLCSPVGGYAPGVYILDCRMFCELDAILPHSWEVTSDSIAVHAAKEFQASRLILQKSIDISPGTPWSEAAANGWVDAYFPTAIADANFPIEVVNFRRWLDERFPPKPVN